MAKLSSYYTLCPLIDQQNLLGVEKDKEPGCAIITLGRNIVIRYKLQDQKQISSWSSKERLTSQVIYDRYKERYAAVFNERKIRVWSEKEADLNNVKGYKFQSPLHEILVHHDVPPVVVQQNGATASLEWAIANRKVWLSKGITKAKEKLLHTQLICLNGKISLYCLTTIEKIYNCIVVKLTDDTCLENAGTIRRIELKRRSEYLVGYTVIQSKGNTYLLTLWSHGRLYSHFLAGSSTDSAISTLINVITNINTKYPVVMTHLNETTVAVYGADAADEGAILMIYNVQFKLVQATQRLKVYTSDAKLWKVEDKLLLAANRHLAVAPYHLAPQRIATMVGSSLRFKSVGNKIDADDVVVIQEATVAQWNENSMHVRDKLLDQMPASISKQISMYLNEGLSDAAIQEILIPCLLKSNDVASICWCLDTFKDLPEKLLVDLLSFSLKSPDKVFVLLQNGATDVSKSASVPCSRNSFLDKMFGLSYSSVSLIPHLKTSLTFDEVLRLLKYLMHKLDERIDSFSDDAQPSEQQLYEWSSVLLDSHYQHYLLSRDTYVLELFDQLSSILEKHYQFLKKLENLRPMLESTINGKSLLKSSQKYNKFYSIEEIKLY